MRYRCGLCALAMIVSAGMIGWCLPAVGDHHENDGGRSGDAGVRSVRDVEGEVAALNAKVSRAEIQRYAAEVDKLIAADLQRAGKRLNPPLNDAQFLRRVYLDGAGRIPSFDETQRFLLNNSRLKRVELIDRVMASDGYVSHMYNYYADLLRVRDNLQGNAPGEYYRNWLKRSIRDNKPYDELVYELLTANGRLEENGAVGYFIRDSGMNLDNTSNTTRVFLGTSIGCAQCHDHPFDKWSQMEFYEMASYTFGVDTRSRGNRALDQAYDMARQAEFEARRSEDPRVRDYQRVTGYLLRLARSDDYEVRDEKRDARLPDDYKYADGKAGQKVEPYPIFGDEVKPSGGQTWREAYGRWMTSKDNPRFAMNIANRLWKRSFGQGLIEPVDEITDGSETAHREVLEYLAGLTVELDFDLRQLQRVILSTRVYQRQASTQEPAKGEAYVMVGPALRRMTAEQTWDSLMTMLVPDIDGTLAYGSLREEERSYEYQKYEGKTAEEVLAMAEQEVMGGGGEGASMMMTMMGGNSRAAGRQRASELPSPAPRGHALRQFGQSDRELIDNGSTEPSVVQVLFLMNGIIDDDLLAERSLLSENVNNAPTHGQKINTIWMSILSKYPDPSEQVVAQDEIRASGVEQGYRNLIWALLNTRQFMFVE